jgi:RNA polymerase sigma-70 factor, ECF subfamily
MQTTLDECAGIRISGAAMLARVAQGDQEAVARLYDDYADAVFRFIYRRVDGCYEDAEELTQDTFLLAVSYAGTYDGSCAQLTWLCCLAKRCIADFCRRRGRQKRIPASAVVSLDCHGGEWNSAGAADPDMVPERLETERLLDEAMARLKPDERDVLLLRYVEQFALGEIAVVLGRSVKGVESLLARARKKAARSVAGVR